MNASFKSAITALKKELHERAKELCGGKFKICVGVMDTNGILWQLLLCVVVMEPFVQKSHLFSFHLC